MENMQEIEESKEWGMVSVMTAHTIHTLITVHVHSCNHTYIVSCLAYSIVCQLVLLTESSSLYASVESYGTYSNNNLFHLPGFFCICNQPEMIGTPGWEGDNRSRNAIIQCHATWNTCQQESKHYCMAMSHLCLKTSQPCFLWLCFLLLYVHSLW